MSDACGCGNDEPRGDDEEPTAPVDVHVLESNVVGRRRTADPRDHPLRAQGSSVGVDE